MAKKVIFLRYQGDKKILISRLYTERNPENKTM